MRPDTSAQEPADRAEAPPGRAGTALSRARRAIAGLIAVVVVLLAFLAGRFLFLGDLVIELHGYVGNAVFVLAIVNLGLGLADGAGGVEMAIAGAVALLTFTQIGLGYVGRDTAEAASLHVPNGVLLMGLAAYQFADLSTRLRSYDHRRS
jgi:hypothetical protein